MRRALAIAVVAAASASVGACGGGFDGGADATELLVLETCAPGRAVEVEVEVCRCAYRELAERFDADELARIDQQLRDDPETVPEAVQEAALSCAFAPVAPPATKPTTTTTSTTEPDDGRDGDTTTTTDRDP